MSSIYDSKNNAEIKFKSIISIFIPENIFSGKKPAKKSPYGFYYLKEKDDFFRELANISNKSIGGYKDYNG